MGYPSINMVATGERIHELMLVNGLSARQVADFMGFGAPQAVYKWLRGDSLPTLDNMYALSVLLHTSMESILVTTTGVLSSFLSAGLFLPAAPPTGLTLIANDFLSVLRPSPYSHVFFRCFTILSPRFVPR